MCVLTREKEEREKERSKRTNNGTKRYLTFDLERGRLEGSRLPFKNDTSSSPSPEEEVELHRERGKKQTANKAPS